MKKEYKVKKRTVVEYLLTAIFAYVFKNIVFGAFEEVLSELTKICIVVGAILLIVALLMLLYELKTKDNFTTGDPVFQYKFESDEEFEKAKEEKPSIYWYSRANLERQYAVVSTGVIAGAGVGLVAWSHIIFVALYLFVLAGGIYIKKRCYEKF